MPSIDILCVIWAALAVPQDPHLRHLDRFPNAEMAAESLAFCCAFRQRMWQAADLKDGNQEYYVDLHWQADFPRLAWDALVDANNLRWDERQRRGALRKLRDRLGEDRWWAGQLPFPIPLNALRADRLLDRYWRGE